MKSSQNVDDLALKNMSNGESDGWEECSIDVNTTEGHHPNKAPVLKMFPVWL